MTARTFWRLQIVPSCVSVAICLDCQLDWVVSACADDCEDLGPLRSWESTCTDSTSPPNLVEIQPLLLFNYCSQYFPHQPVLLVPPAHLPKSTMILLSPAQIISHILLSGHTPLSANPKVTLKFYNSRALCFWFNGASSHFLCTHWTHLIAAAASRQENLSITFWKQSNKITFF